MLSLPRWLGSIPTTVWPCRGRGMTFQASWYTCWEKWYMNVSIYTTFTTCVICHNKDKTLEIISWLFLKVLLTQTPIIPWWAGGFFNGPLKSLRMRCETLTSNELPCQRNWRVAVSRSVRSRAPQTDQRPPTLCCPVWRPGGALTCSPTSRGLRLITTTEKT